MCSTWLPAVFGVMFSRLAMLLFGSPWAQQPKYVCLAGGEGGRRARTGKALRLTGRDEDGIDGQLVESSVPGLGSEFAGGGVLAQRWSIGTRLGHRVIRVGRGEHARRHRQHRPAESSVVAGAVHPLVVRSREQPDPVQWLGPGEDPLDVVDVHAHSFGFAAVEWPGLVPYRPRYAEATEVVHQRGPAGELHLRIGRPATGSERR